MSEVDQHFSGPSLYGYRLTISYFRLAKSLVESYPRILSVTPSWISLREVICFGLAAGRKTAASIPRGTKQTPGFVRS